MEESTAPLSTRDSLRRTILDRVKNSSMAILTPLNSDPVWTTLPRDAREKTIVVLDTTYSNELDGDENRYFLVCSDNTTYSMVSNAFQSDGIRVQPKLNISYWRYIRKRIENGDVYGDTSSLRAHHQAAATEAAVDGTDAQSYTLTQLAVDISPSTAVVTTNRPRRTVYGRARLDTITNLIVKFSGISLSSLIAFHEKNIRSSSSLVTASSANTVGPTGQPSFLQSIIDHESPWTRKAVKAATQAASQEAKMLKREFCEKYQPLVNKCRIDPRHTLTLDQAMHIINNIEDRYERKKWMASQLREMRKLKKEVNIMVLEYMSLMDHCRKLQRACIAAGNEAYDINIVLLKHPPSTSPAPTLP
ncbi:hypothetical protein FRC00_010010 [Tulasnella sp. 408]|nr:hypothetical protein FRC00_010010 [Tulasnella sp. 408]